MMIFLLIFVFLIGCGEKAPLPDSEPNTDLDKGEEEVFDKDYKLSKIITAEYADDERIKISATDVFNEKVPLYFKNIKKAPALTYNFPQQVERVDLLKNAKIIHYCGGDKPFSEKINKMFLSHSLWYYYYYQLNK